MIEGILLFLAQTRSSICIPHTLCHNPSMPGLTTILVTLAVPLVSVSASASASADDHCDDNTKPEYDELECGQGN